MIHADFGTTLFLFLEYPLYQHNTHSLFNCFYKLQRKPKGQSRKNNTKTQSTFGTRHRMKTNKTNIPHRKLKERVTPPKMILFPISIEQILFAGADPGGELPARVPLPPRIGKNMIFLRKIVIFHTKSAPPNFKSWIRPCFGCNKTNTELF